MLNSMIYRNRQVYGNFKGMINDSIHAFGIIIAKIYASSFPFKLNTYTSNFQCPFAWTKEQYIDMQQNIIIDCDNEGYSQIKTGGDKFYNITGTVSPKGKEYNAFHRYGNSKDIFIWLQENDEILKQGLQDYLLKALIEKDEESKASLRTSFSALMDSPKIQTCYVFMLFFS